MVTKEREVITMKIKQQVLTIHQFTATEWATLCDAENLVRKVYESYDDNTVIVNPNTGECVLIDELPKVIGILSFLAENRVVEVSPRQRG
jgi:hypothetical protein